MGLKMYNPVKIRLNPSDPICVRPHLPGADVLGFQDVMKQQEIRRNKEKMTKKLRKKKPKTQQKPATILWRILLAILAIKLGIF